MELLPWISDRQELRLDLNHNLSSQRKTAITVLELVLTMASTFRHTVRNKRVRPKLEERPEHTKIYANISLKPAHDNPLEPIAKKALSTSVFKETTPFFKSD